MKVINMWIQYTQSSLEKVIEDAIQLSKHPLNDEQVQDISESFK